VAVYTQVSAEDAASFLAKYDAGELISFKGIAEGVENSNYLVETTKSKYFLTLYESRVDPAQLPFFHDLLGHLKQAGCLVPAFIHDREDNWLQQLCGRPACLIEFLSGVSPSEPGAAQANAIGTALGELHLALRDFDGHRPNSMGLAEWRRLANECGDAALDDIAPGLAARIDEELSLLERDWPVHLPHSVIHGDLFPDNVLMLGNTLSGLIDFYFACTEIRSFDIAVTHAAWSFSSDGAHYLPQIGTAILDGYRQTHGIDAETLSALPLLFRGACLRFLLSRCYDWVNTPAGALVTPKNPTAFLYRLDFYANPANKDIILG